MIADPDVAMLLFGGGEVSNEILPLIDYAAIRDNPKIICSYSDGTTVLNAIASLSGVATFYGQSLRTFFELTDYNRACFKRAFLDGDAYEFQKNSNWKMIHSGERVGELIGGYLPNFALMINGGYFKFDREKKYILFVEDHINFSSCSVISKYFSHIEQSGFFDCVSGMIFGHYSDAPSSVLSDILARLGEKYNIPVVKCGDFGHGANNAVLPLGISAELNAGQGTLQFLERFVAPS